MSNQGQPLPGLTQDETQHVSEVLNHIRAAWLTGTFDEYIAQFLANSDQRAAVEKFFGIISNTTDSNLQIAMGCLTAPFVTKSSPPP